MTYKSQNEKVWEYLQSNDFITARDMCKNLNICHPPSRIRDLRKKYGEDTILDRWITKQRIEYNKEGKEEKVTTRYKQYFLNKLGGVA